MVEATLQQSRIAGLLGCTPLLAGLPPEQLNALAGHCQLVRYGIGQPICRQGQPGGHLWLLIEGQARTVVRSRRLPRGIATLTRPTAGALLGLGGGW